MKKLLIFTVIMSFTVLTFAKDKKKANGPDPVQQINIDSALRVMNKKINALNKKVAGLNEKIETTQSSVKVVEVDLSDFKTETNDNFTGVNNNFETLKGGLKKLNDSLKAMNDSTGVLTILKKGNKTNNEKATLARNIGIGAGVVALLALILLFFNKRSGRRNMD